MHWGSKANVVRDTRLELVRPKGQKILNLQRLPIPPTPLIRSQHPYLHKHGYQQRCSKSLLVDRRWASFSSQCTEKPDGGNPLEANRFEGPIYLLAAQRFRVMEGK